MYPYGPPPDPPPSRIHPPWRDKRDDTALMVVLAVVGAFIPWLVVVVGLVAAIGTQWRYPELVFVGTGVLLGLLLILAIVGALIPNPRWLRGLGFGLLIGLALVVITVACIAMALAACFAMFANS